jgi:hypothetical protein
LEHPSEQSSGVFSGIVPESQADPRPASRGGPASRLPQAVSAPQLTRPQQPKSSQSMNPSQSSSMPLRQAPTSFSVAPPASQRIVPASCIESRPQALSAGQLTTSQQSKSLQSA